MKTVVIRVDACGKPYASFEGAEEDYPVTPLHWKKLPKIFKQFLRDTEKKTATQIIKS